MYLTKNKVKKSINFISIAVCTAVFVLILVPKIFCIKDFTNRKMFNYILMRVNCPGPGVSELGDLHCM